MGLQVGIDDIAHVDGVQVVGPRMENLETLVLDLLLPVPLNILFQEGKGGLVGLDRVVQVVFQDFFRLAEETTDSFNARGGLQILSVDHLVEVLLQSGDGRALLKTNHLKHTQHYSFEALQVPVLVDDLVDDSSLEHLMNLQRPQVNQVVHVVDGLGVFH